MALPGLRMPVVERHDCQPEVPLWLNPFISRENAMRHDRGVHARRYPPQAAAPGRWISIRFLVPDYKIIRGSDNAGALERIVDSK